MTPAEELIAANPFPGLRSFMPSEADRFFGREQQIGELAERLDRSALVSVAGASGCGKSSLVLAGLLSELERRRAAGSQVEWHPVLLRPGNYPITSLATRLAAVVGAAGQPDEMRAASLDGRLRLGGLGLVEAVRMAQLPSHVRVLVVVDQFEEIFRFKRITDPEEAAAFVKLLLNAASDRDSPVSVMLTLRSDTLGYCADFRGLPEAINRGQYLVPRLTREQRKLAIVGPVELRGFQITPRLVQRLLNDVSDDFDDLPVMQHVLARTWWQWAKDSKGARPIDLQDYEATGAVVTALSAHADEAHASLNGLGAVAERIFRALTVRVGEGTEIRRPLEFERLCAVVGQDETQVAQVVDRFRRADTAFLTPSSEVELATNPVIDISHESLIRQWKRLRQWAQEEAESRAELLRVLDAADRKTHGNGDLWRRRDLERGLDWRDRARPTEAWVGLCTGGSGVLQWEAARRFLTACEKAARRERRRWRMLVSGLCGLALAVVAVSVIAAVSAFGLQRQARSRELANRSLLDLALNPARSAHLALAAINQDPDNAVAEYALRQSLATLEVARVERIIPLGQPIADARLTRDGSRFVVAGKNTVWVLDALDYKLIGAPVEVAADLSKAWLIADNGLLVTLSSNGQGQIRHLVGGGVQDLSCDGRETDDRKTAITALSISADEHSIAVGCSGGATALWNVSRANTLGLPLSPAGRTPVTALAFSFDNQYLAAGDFLGTVRIWKLGSPGLWIGPGKDGTASPIQHRDSIRDIAFHPSDSEMLATASDDSTAEVWQLDLAHRRLRPTPKGARTPPWKLMHERPVTTVRFTPRSSAHPLMTISDKRVRFWDNEESHEVRGHDDWVTDASVSENGELVVSASSDGTARVWSTRSGAPIAVLRGHRSGVSRAFFAPDAKIVTTSGDGSLRIWDIRPPQLLAVEAGWILGAALDKTGRRILLCGEERGCGIIAAEDLARRETSNDQPLERAGVGPAGWASWSADDKLVMGHLEDQGLSNAIRPTIWDSRTGHNVTPRWLDEWRTAIFGPGTPELITVKGDGSLAVWETAAIEQSNPQPRLRIGPKAGRERAAMSPDGKWIATLEDETVALFSVAPNAPTSSPRLLEGHRGHLRSVMFSPDSRKLVTASDDRTARVWLVEPPPGQAQSFVELAGGHGAALSSAVFSGDGRQVVTGSADNTVRVWDAQNGHELAALRWHADAVNQVRVTPDGQILSVSDDGTAKLGRCDACTQKIAELRARVPREAVLTPEELKEIQKEGRVTMSYFKLPALQSTVPGPGG